MRSDQRISRREALAVMGFGPSALGWPGAGLPSRQSGVTPAGGLDVREFGARGDGTTDDTKALQTAFKTAAGRPLHLAGGRFLIAAPLSVPSGFYLYGPGVFVADKAMGSSDPVLDVNGVTRVHLAAFEIDGNRQAFEPATEHRHGLRIVGSSAHVTLQDLYLHDCKGDGVYIGSGDGATYVQHVLMSRVWCDGNHRQGMSITALRAATFRDCWFTNTGGTSPQSGVDVEPNSPRAIVQDLLFDGGGAYGNKGDGFIFSLSSQASAQQNIYVRGFTSRDNKDNGFLISNGGNLRIEGCNVYGNGAHGVAVTGNCAGVGVDNNDVYLNGYQGILVAARLPSDGMSDLRISNNRVFDNSSARSNIDDAIRIDWRFGKAAGCVGVVVTGNACGNRDTSNQRYAITTAGGANVMDLVLASNLLKGCATGVALLQDDPRTRRVRGNAGLDDN